jgi:hypothetical protein
VNLALTTRSELAAKYGLAPFVKRALLDGFPAVVLEPPAPGQSFAATVEDLVRLEAPVLGMVGAPTPPSDSPEATLATVEKGARRSVADSLAGALSWLSPLKCRRLLIPIGPAGFFGEPELRRKLEAPGADRAALRREFSAANAAQRQSHAVVMCRELFDLGRRLAGAKLHLLPTADPLSFLDPETADWILGDLKDLALALDFGAVAASAHGGGDDLRVWLDRTAGSLGFILLSDHDGRGDGALLPGAGRLDVATFRDVIGRRTPVALRCDPRASWDDVKASAQETARRLGPVGDLSAW